MDGYLLNDLYQKIKSEFQTSAEEEVMDVVTKIGKTMIKFVLVLFPMFIFRHIWQYFVTSRLKAWFLKNKNEEIGENISVFSRFLEENKLHSKDWVESSIRDLSYEDNYLKVGYIPIYLGRTFYQGDLQTCKVILDGKSAYVSYACKAQPIEKFQICTIPKSDIEWQLGNNGNVPLNAIPIGETANKEELYIGRLSHNGSLIPGKIHPSCKGIFIPYNNKEVGSFNYEMMVHKTLTNQEDIKKYLSYKYWEETSIKKLAYKKNYLIVGYVPIHLGIVTCGNNLFPVKVILEHKKALLLQEKLSQCTEKVQMCCIPKNNIRWIRSKNGTIPSNAIPIGKNNNGEYLYAGRCNYMKSRFCGEVDSSNGSFSFLYNDSKLTIKRNYEIMVHSRVVEL